MPNPRLAYQNLLSSSTFNSFQTAGGAVANQPSGWSPLYAYVAGRVGFESQGTYTGDLERDYVVEIHVCPDGTFANTRWRWSDSGGSTWNQQNLTPVSGSFVSLSFGIQVRFIDQTA